MFNFVIESDYKYNTEYGCTVYSEILQINYRYIFLSIRYHYSHLKILHYPIDKNVIHTF